MELGLKPAATIRFLATGNSYVIQRQTRQKHTLSFFPEVCKAIIDAYKDKVRICPKTEDQWKEVAQKFGSRWSNCLGAIEGKHFAIKKPPRADSWYSWQLQMQGTNFYMFM